MPTASFVIVIGSSGLSSSMAISAVRILVVLAIGSRIFIFFSLRNKFNSGLYSTYDFADVTWTRDSDCDVETLRFLPNGEFRYSCACGNPVNDADVVDSYSYDEATKTFTLNCCEEIEDMITEIKLVSCDEEKLELDFDGEVRVFTAE